MHRSRTGEANATLAAMPSVRGKYSCEGENNMSAIRSFRKQIIKNLTGRFLNNGSERGNGERIIDEARSAQRSKQSKAYPEDHDAAFRRKLNRLLNAETSSPTHRRS